MSTNTFSLKYSFGFQLFLLLAITGFLFLLSTLSMLGWAAINMPAGSFNKMDEILKNPSNAYMLKWINVISTLFLFGLPPIFLAWIVSYKPFKFLGFNGNISTKEILLVVAILFIGYLLTSGLSQFTDWIPLPKIWIERFKKMETAYSDSIVAMITMKNFWQYLGSLFVIAVCPAIFEELFFRAGFQTLLVNWTKKPLLAIVLVSIFFSAVHGSYYGFLGRIFLGLGLGLVYYYSQNIWLSILYHFLNNGLIVTIAYIYQILGGDINQFEEISEQATRKGYWFIFFIIIGAYIFYILIKNFKKAALQAQPVDVNTYYRKQDNPFLAPFIESEQTEKPQ